MAFIRLVMACARRSCFRNYISCIWTEWYIRFITFHNISTFWRHEFWEKLYVIILLCTFSSVNSSQNNFPCNDGFFFFMNQSSILHVSRNCIQWVNVLTQISVYISTAISRDYIFFFYIFSFSLDLMKTWALKTFFARYSFYSRCEYYFWSAPGQ